MTKGNRNVKTELIQTSIIRLDGGTQIRETIDSSVVTEYAEAMKAGTDFPPILVCKDGAGTLWLADGFHRLHGAREAGIDTINCEVTPGSKRDAVLLAAGANSDHGLRRTNADKRRSVLTLLKDPEWGKWSNRKIADFCAVSESTVRRIVEEEVRQKRTPDTSKGDSASKTKAAPSKAEGIEGGKEAAGGDNEGEGENQLPAKPEPVLDIKGRVIPDKFRHIFTAGSDKFGEILADLTMIQTRINELANEGDTGAGVHISPARVKANIVQLRDEMKHARPYSVCPTCAGKGCEVCFTLGWVNKSRYETVGDKMIALFESKMFGKAGAK